MAEDTKNEFDLTKLVEVELVDEDSFLVIKETLTRIGIASKKENTLYQTAHILHKRGKYYIAHFKYLFELDGRKSDISDFDIKRQNTIAKLLNEWGLLTIVSEVGETCPLTSIKILPFGEKHKWQLVKKYNLGK